MELGQVLADVAALARLAVALIDLVRARAKGARVDSASPEQPVGSPDETEE